ncbi:STAS domain-containing protein [Actinomadura sp. NTSP31]|uniref:STAS domain-containing protein n=1 Tax=Actinomadura sp. NTSP31 TaxID=1735447 RepID=UPI0035BFF26E
MLVQPVTPQLAADSDAPATGGPAGAPPDPRERPALVIETEERGDATVLSMAGPLVAGTLVTAEARILTTTVLAGRPLDLVLDLTRVDTIDQHGANLLSKTRFTVCAARGTLHIVAPRDGAVHPRLNRYLRQVTVERREDLPAPARQAETTAI